MLKVSLFMNLSSVTVPRPVFTVRLICLVIRVCVGFTGTAGNCRICSFFACHPQNVGSERSAGFHRSGGQTESFSQWSTGQPRTQKPQVVSYTIQRLSLTSSQSVFPNCNRNVGHVAVVLALGSKELWICLFHWTLYYFNVWFYLYVIFWNSHRFKVFIQFHFFVILWTFNRFYIHL